MSVQARALIAADGGVQLGTVAVPDPGRGQVRIRVRWAGVGDADLAAIRAGARGVLGREVVGDIDAIGANVVGLAVGQPVVVDPRLPCGRCPTCVVDPNGCDDAEFLGIALPGGFAEYVTVPEPMVHGLPDVIDGALGVLVAPLAVALHTIAAGAGPLTLVGYGTVAAMIQLEARRRGGWALDVVEASPTRAALAQAHGAIVVADIHGDLHGEHVDCARPPVQSGWHFDAAMALLAAEPVRYRSVLTDHASLKGSAARIAAELKHPTAVGLVLAVSEWR